MMYEMEHEEDEDQEAKKDVLKQIQELALGMMGDKLASKKKPMAVEVEVTAATPKDDPEEKKKRLKEALGLS